jgi:hypothetical protein
MSDTVANPQDAAIEACRERARQFDADIQDLARRMEVATACRDQFLDMAATLARKSRSTRKPRVASETAPASAPETAPPGEAKPPRSPLFAVPDVASEPAEEAA